jgi:hypothetical protein
VAWDKVASPMSMEGYLTSWNNGVTVPMALVAKDGAIQPVGGASHLGTMEILCHPPSRFMCPTWQPKVGPLMVG